MSTPKGAHTGGWADPPDLGAVSGQPSVARERGLAQRMPPGCPNATLAFERAF
ncbi:hypothetical protein [Streptomyces sp. AP-93]|uniref:hypothetical protein n=1 Tax=Streptomyces sp. AP-93 TaxID=2929048 RepID=UPI001FAEA41A|nr:hypothetical protein [Streptomyces sp. AP-93]MCJ0875262.1 hypothetical protein [Streptomyces sp. AP-93]